MIKISYQKNEESNKIRKPNTTDNEILSFLKNKGEPQKFQEIAVGLKYSSGKLQTALGRMV
ncbi:MAG: hypothetical protein GY870_14815, partial [archaeon]|nr:hypothetical protein [archaeon]